MQSAGWSGQWVGGSGQWAGGRWQVAGGSGQARVGSKQLAVTGSSGQQVGVMLTLVGSARCLLTGSLFSLEISKVGGTTSRDPSSYFQASCRPLVKDLRWAERLERSDTRNPWLGPSTFAFHNSPHRHPSIWPRSAPDISFCGRLLRSERPRISNFCDIDPSENNAPLLEIVSTSDRPTSIARMPSYTQ